MFHGFGKFKQQSDGSEYAGHWRQNQMKGNGVKKSNGGMVELSGHFDGRGVINGKGYKKWKKFSYEQQTFYPYKLNKIEEVFLYRGNLKDSQIQGYGEFKWPDGRHYIGDFVNSQMQGQGKMTWATKAGKKIIYKGQFLANVFHGDGTLSLHNGDTYEGQFENGKFNGEGFYKWSS